MRKLSLSYFLIFTSVLMVGCNGNDDKAKNNTDLAKSESEKITSRSWCIAKINAYNEIEISRFSLLSNNFFTVEDVLIDTDKELLVYPSIESSEKKFWLLGEDGFGDSIGVKLSAFDPTANSWKRQEKIFSVFSDKKPIEQLDMNTQSVLSTEPVKNSAFPCETFSADLANKAPNRLKIEKEFRDALSLNQKGDPFVFFPKEVKYPLSIARIDKSDLTKKSWCRDSMYGVIKILSFDPNGTIKEKTLMKPVSADFSIFDSSGTWVTENWSQSSDTLDVLFKNTYRDPNDDLTKKMIDFDVAMEKAYGPEKAFFLEDRNGNIFYTQARDGLISIDLMSLYTDCNQFFDEVVGSFKFSRFNFTPLDLNNPFPLTVN
ncbi:hypothetical protein K2X05_12985 [bacterium]|nr:hypothetical protein [bacterium]